MADANATADPHQSPPVKRAKRTRVLLACQRCKSRKQKCDGSQPKCATCNRLDLECRYVLPSHPKPQEARIYIKSLENRVAELEMCLARGGQSDAALDHLTSYQNPSEGESVERVGVFSLLSTVRDLSLNTSGSYVGGTSTITLARILESVVGRTDQSQLALPTSTWMKDESPPPDFVPSEDDCISPGSASSTAASFQMQPDVGDKLVEAYLKHVSTNFIVLHSAQIKDLHKRRNSLNDPCEESILHLIYSLGAQYLESTQSGESGNYHWRYHFEVALGNRDKILQLGDTCTLKYLLLLVQHCLRIPRHPGAWTFSGIAMRLCVELGLHRRKRSRLQPNLQSELEKRLFWACYYMDRELSIALGRPPCISDHDIDIPLPLDVEEENQDVDVFRRAVESNSPSNPPTTMTVYIHILRLKRIESEIQHTIYRVDGCPASNMSQETDQFLERLAAWRNAIPSQSHDHSLTTYMVAYHKCVRLLLQPQLYESMINERYLTLCTQACSGVCETYRRLHDTQPVAFSTLSLQSVFLAGLTLVYCLWHAPSSTAIRYMSSLSDCSILLYIMTERWPVIRRYRDSFEAIKRSVLHLISEDKHQPGKAIPVMPADVRSTLQGLEVNMTENINRDDLEHMIGDMTGESLAFWNQVNMDLSFPVDEELQFLGDLDGHRDHGSGNDGMGELNSDWIDSIDGRFLNSGMLNSGMVVGWDGDGS